MSWGAALQPGTACTVAQQDPCRPDRAGVIIGVASVIAMVAIGAGAQQRIAETLETSAPTRW